jgi:hypothetical protein
MSITSASAIQTNNIDTISATGMIIGQTNANGITIGSSAAGRTPSIIIDTQSTLNTQDFPAIAIGTSASSKTIRIGNSANTVVVSALTFGAETINNFTGTTGTTGAGNIAIGNLQTSGTIGIGNSAARTGQISIGAGVTSSGPIIIGSGGSARVTVRIGNGGTGATGSILIGTTNVQTTIFGLLNVSQPFNLSYVTLPTLSATQVGFTSTQVLGNTLIPTTNGVSQVLFSVTLSQGVWAISYQVRVSPNTNQSATLTGLISSLSLSTQLNGINHYGYSGIVPLSINFPDTGTSFYGVNGCATIANTVSNNVISLNSSLSYTAGTGDMRWRPSVTYLIATRIA